MRVQMPDINEPRRWKRGSILTVKTQAEADALVAQGGSMLPAEPEEEKPEPKGKAHK